MRTTLSFISADAGGRYKPGIRPHPAAPCCQGAAV